MNNMIKNKATERKKRREVKPIDDTTSRQVTFSKRRVGVFKKAGELCVLTGAQAAILCESVGGRVYAFGHPSVEHVVDEYLGNKNSSDLPGYNSAATEAHVNSSCMHDEELKKVKKQYLEISEELEIEKSKSQNKNLINHDNFNKNEEEGDFWWQQPFDHLEEEELEEYISSMETLMNNLKLRANDLRLIRTSSLMFDASNTLNSNDTESSDEYLANKPTTKDYELPDEFFATKNLPKQDNGVPNEFFTNKDMTTKGYGLTNDFFTNKDLTTKGSDLLDEFFTNKNLTKQDYGVPCEFFTNKNTTKQGYGLPDEFFANKNLTTKGYGLLDEFSTNKKLNLNYDGLLNDLLVTNDPDFNDELDAFFTDPELPVDCGNNMQVPNNAQLSHINANLVAPDENHCGTDHCCSSRRI